MGWKKRCTRIQTYVIWYGSGIYGNTIFLSTLNKLSANRWEQITIICCWDSFVQASDLNWENMFDEVFVHRRQIRENSSRTLYQYFHCVRLLIDGRAREWNTIADTTNSRIRYWNYVFVFRASIERCINVAEWVCWDGRSVKQWSGFFRKYMPMALTYGNDLWLMWSNFSFSLFR